MLNRRKRIRELEEENIAFSDRIGMMEDKLENSNLEYKILMKKYDDKSDAYDNLTYKYEDLLEENKDVPPSLIFLEGLMIEMEMSGLDDLKELIDVIEIRLD